MKTPVFLLGLALLFWGWQTGLWIFALPIALIIEFSNFTDSRWDLGDEEFQRVSNLSLVILLVLAVYLGIFTRSIYFVGSGKDVVKVRSNRFSDLSISIAKAITTNNILRLEHYL